MASGVNVKMGVSGVAQFKQSINQAKQSVKTLDAQIALSEKQFKANGDAQSYMAEKSELLKAKLEAQKSVVTSAENALKQMADRGVYRSSKAYQDMYRQMLQAKGAMLDTQTEMDKIGESASEAADDTKDMNDEIKNIGKQVSFETVTSGINKITDSMEKAAKTAYKVGSAIVKEVLGVGTWADDVNTRSAVLGVSPEELQRMEKTARLIDTDAETIIKARQKLAKNIGSGNKNAMSALEAMGISGNGDMEDVFWAAGNAIMKLSDETEQEAQANALFGKSWHDLIPLFSAGREEYERMNSSWNVMSEEQLKQLNEMDDEYQKLKIAVEDLKKEALSNLAEPMKEALTAINDLLGKVSAWLKSDEGKAAVGNVVSKIKEAAEWLVNNKEGVVAALGAIVAGWAGLKLTGGALQILQLLNGINALKGGGAAAAAAGGASGGAGGAVGTAGAAGGGFFAKLAGGAKALAASGLGTTVAAVAAGIIPPIIANAMDDRRVEEKRQSRLASASMMGPGVDSEFLTRASNALGLNWHGGNESEVLSILMGMKDRSDLQKAQLQAQLNGSSTSQGNITWNELQRLWNGTEEFDSARLNATLESVTDSYTKMAEQTSELTGATDESSKASQEMSAAAKSMMDIPGLVGDAVRSGMSGITFVLDGSAITNYVDRQLGNKVNMERR
ncbi:MAG: hypothetical protein UHU21_02770 [Lachnospiraceae bacterium]|nr:hypothetical protein [Lachnospiraceae bacterium]